MRCILEVGVHTLASALPRVYDHGFEYLNLTSVKVVCSQSQIIVIFKNGTGETLTEARKNKIEYTLKGSLGRVGSAFKGRFLAILTGA